MPVLSNNQFLDNVTFNRLILEWSVRYQELLPLRFLDRLPIVQADDDEIIATFTNRRFAADIIADDQAAVVYEGGVLNFITNTLANIKSGRRVSQAMLQRIIRLRQRSGTAGDLEAYQNWEAYIAQQVLIDVRERMNYLACAMMIDNLNHNRLGVQITGNWGMPAAQKVTPTTLWTSTAATPITDVMTIKMSAATTFGITLDRMTISHADFLNMAKTTEFQQLIPGLVNAPLLTTAFNARDPRLVGFASMLLGMDIEFEDKQFSSQNPDGSITTSRVLPLGKVLLSAKSDDNNAGTWDFGSAVVTESVVAGAVGDPDNAPQGPQYGPIGYYTSDPQLNPPSITGWAVFRGFPRKHNPNATAVLTVQ